MRMWDPRVAPKIVLMQFGLSITVFSRYICRFQEELIRGMAIAYKESYRSVETLRKLHAENDSHDWLFTGNGDRNRTDHFGIERKIYIYWLNNSLLYVSKKRSY